ncbi:hypothetical protein F4777DRAFT_601312 [Nemania sp. FL0916]|nr:hypothetical protein F4777DRAFT_601312 [Nemania sp. FL0916]
MSLVPAAPTGVLPAAFASTTVRAGPQGSSWLILPTSQPQNRALLGQLAINDDESRVAALPSVDIEIRLRPGEDVRALCAKIIRREGYFRAVLVQSRGQVSPACANKCGSERGGGTFPFRECRTLPGFQDGACGSCVWHSHGRKCTHHT